MKKITLFITITLLILSFFYPSAASANSITYWQESDEGINGISWSLFSHLVIDPVTPSTLYLAAGLNGLYKSTNGGGSWNRIGLGLPTQYIYDLVIDPRNHNVLYVAMDSWGTYKSTDGGSTWARIFQAPYGWESIYNLVVDPQTSTNLYACESDLGLIKSTDGGRTWTEKHDGIPVGWHIRDLAIDPDNPAILYVFGVSNDYPPYSGIFRTSNAGEFWDDFSYGLPDTVGRGLLLSPSDSNILYTLFYFWGGPGPVNEVYYKLYKSTDGANNWWEVSGIYPLYISYGLAVDPQNADILYTWGEDSSYNFNIWKSTNGGRTWSLIYIDSTLYADYLTINPQNQNELYMSADEGVYKSVSGGDSWTVVNDGIKAFITTSIAINPNNPSIMYALIDNLGLYKSTDGGQNWSVLWNDWDAKNMYTLVIDPKNPQILYAYSSLRLMRSDDGGQNWIGADDGIRNHVRSFAIDPLNTNKIYVGTHSRGLFHSLDYGRTWQQSFNWDPPILISSIAIDPQKHTRIYLGTLEPGINNSTTVLISDTPYGFDFREKGHGLDGHRNMLIDEILIHPLNTQLVYLKTDEGLFKSENGGEYWMKRDPSTFNRNIAAAALDPQDTSKIYISEYNEGISTSLDGGATWRAINSGVPTRYGLCLAIDPQDPTNVFYGTIGYGIYRTGTKVHLPMLLK